MIGFWVFMRWFFLLFCLFLFYHFMLTTANFLIHMLLNRYFLHALLLFILLNRVRVVLLSRLFHLEILRFLQQFLWLVIVLNIIVLYFLIRYCIFVIFCRLWLWFWFFHFLFWCFLFSVLTWCLENIYVLIIINCSRNLNAFLRNCLIMGPHSW